MALIASRANGGTTFIELVTLGAAPAPGQHPVGVGFACATRGRATAVPPQPAAGAGLPQTGAARRRR